MIAINADERGGSPSVEAAVLAVVVGLLIAFAIAGGRLVTAEAAADHSARSAARAASLQRDAASADRAAHDSAELGLTQQGVRCAALDIVIDTSGFARALGASASVTATVRCEVRWADLGLLGTPGTRVVESTSVSPIDQWRERP
ncbi:TadE/TadG family type IV pilus assembly protein [Pseudonocardia sichuanensis]